MEGLEAEIFENQSDLNAADENQAEYTFQAISSGEGEDNPVIYTTTVDSHNASYSVIANKSDLSASDQRPSADGIQVENLFPSDPPAFEQNAAAEQPKPAPKTTPKAAPKTTPTVIKYKERESLRKKSHVGALGKNHSAKTEPRQTLETERPPVVNPNSGSVATATERTTAMTASHPAEPFPPNLCFERNGWNELQIAVEHSATCESMAHERRSHERKKQCNVNSITDTETKL